MSASNSVDPVQFARGGRRLAGAVPSTGFERLAAFVEPSAALVQYSLSGRIRPDGKCAIVLEADVVLSLTCDRCGSAVEWPVAARRELVFVDASKMPAIEDEEEGSDYLPADERVDPLALVEEELILALPMAPRHDGCVPGAAPRVH